MWKEAESQGKAWHNEKVKVDAVSCNGDKIAIVGRITLPNININMVEIPVQVSFWVMKQPTDGVIMANKWLTTPLRASLAWCEELQGQVLYFKIPTTPLRAGGKSIKIPDRLGAETTQLTRKKEEATDKTKHNELQGDNCPCERCQEDKQGSQTEQKEEEFDDEDADADARRYARSELQEEMKEETTTRASGVSTVKASRPQPRSQLGNNSCQLDTRDKAIEIARHGQESITLNRGETKRIQKAFP